MPPTSQRTNVTPTGYTYGGVNYETQTRTAGNGSTYTVDVPTKAPTGTTPVTALQALPTPVVSTTPAVTQVGKITDTMNQANADIQKQQDLKAQTAQNTQTAPVVKAETVKTPEQALIDTPETGNKFVYDSLGNRSEIGVNESLPSGYSPENPTVAPTKTVTGTAEIPSGTSYKQYADGTYGRFDVNGNYQGTATQQDFTNAQHGQSILDSLNQAINGAYPLKANQQAQIDSVKAIYADLIKKQETANANLTGGTTIAQNLYGLGNTTVGIGTIKQTVDDGIAKIITIQSNMNSDVAKMTSAFQSDNLNELKSAYESFSNNAKELQANIDNIHNEAVQRQREQVAYQQNQESAVDASIRSMIDDAQKGGLVTPDQLTKMQEALKSHDYGKALESAGSSLTNLNTLGGQYAYAIKNGWKGVGGDTSITAFIQAQNEAKSAGTAIGKQAGTSITNNSSTGIITIPQNAGSSINQLAYQNNNPGNLRFAGQKGASQGTGGFAKFDSPQAGFDAMVADVTAKMTGNSEAPITEGPNINKKITPDSTLFEMISAYAPRKDGNDPVEYANFVAKQLGVTPETKVSQLDPMNTAKAMALNESGTTFQGAWNTRDASAPPAGDGGSQQYGITGRTSNALWQDAITYSLDKTKQLQGFAGGLAGSDLQAKAIKDAVDNKSAALMEAAGVNRTEVQREYASGSGSMNKISNQLNSVQTSMTSAANNGDSILKMFEGTGINQNDSTYLNTKLNDLIKNFGDMGTIKAYQTALNELQTDYSNVYSRAGVNNVKNIERAEDAFNPNMTLADLKKTIDVVSTLGQQVVDSNISQIKTIADATNMPNLSKFLKFVQDQEGNKEPDQATQQVVNQSQQQDAISQLDAFDKADIKNQNVINDLHTAFPNATPQEIYDKLKTRGLI